MLQKLIESKFDRFKTDLEKQISLANNGVFKCSERELNKLQEDYESSEKSKFVRTMDDVFFINQERSFKDWVEAEFRTMKEQEKNYNSKITNDIKNLNKQYEELEENNKALTNELNKLINDCKEEIKNSNKLNINEFTKINNEIKQRINILEANINGTESIQDQFKQLNDVISSLKKELLTQMYKVSANIFSSGKEILIKLKDYSRGSLYDHKLFLRNSRDSIEDQRQLSKSAIDKYSKIAKGQMLSNISPKIYYDDTNLLYQNKHDLNTVFESDQTVIKFDQIGRAHV